jgi:hypothetical protein
MEYLVFREAIGGNGRSNFWKCSTWFAREMKRRSARFARSSLIAQMEKGSANASCRLRFRTAHLPFEHGRVQQKPFELSASSEKPIAENPIRQTQRNTSEIVGPLLRRTLVSFNYDEESL